MYFRSRAALAATVFVSALSAAALTAHGQAQSQFFANQAPDSPGTVMTFDRYAGPFILTKVEARAQAVVHVRFYNDMLSGLPPFNLYAGLTLAGFIPLAPNPALPIDLYSGPAISLTDSSDGGPVAEVSFVLPEVATVYTDPAALDFFRGTAPFSYQGAAAVNANVDSWVYSLIGTNQQPEVRLTMGVNLFYTTAIPEPAAAGLLAPAAMLLTRRRTSR
jgi:hypothetical protein